MCVIVPVFYGVGNKEKDYDTSDEEGRIKTKDIAVCQKCYSQVHAKGSNTSNLVSNLTTQPYTGLFAVQWSTRRSDNILRIWMNNSSNQPSQALWRRYKNMIDKAKKWHNITNAVTFCLSCWFTQLRSLDFVTCSRKFICNMICHLANTYQK